MPQKVKVDDIKQTLGFGEYRDWRYADVLMYKYPYAKYLMGDQDEQCPSKKNPAAWTKWKNDGVEEDKRTGDVEREGGTCLPSVRNSES